MANNDLVLLGPYYTRHDATATVQEAISDSSLLGGIQGIYYERGTIFVVGQTSIPDRNARVYSSDGMGVDATAHASGNALLVYNVNSSGGGGDGVILDGVDSGIKATVKDLTNSNPLTVAIVDADGSQIASFGGGTQYTEGDTDATITGTALLWEDAADTLTPVSASKPLPVNTGLTVQTDALTDTELRATPVPVSGTFWQATQPVSAASLPLPTGAATSAGQLPDGHNVTVDNVGGLEVFQATAADLNATIVGTVTANAGTNLNTSALALESGGNLATIAGKDFATQTTLAAINAKLVTGTDIGDVTINNASGVSAVNIQDGGNSITVDGTVAVTNADLTSIKTAVELLDNSVDGNYLNTNLNIAGTDVSAGAGVLTAQTQRVTIATDDEVNNLLGTIDVDTGNIVAAVQIMDDWDNAASDGASVSGDVAHDSADAGEPVKTGGKAVLFNGSAPPNAVVSEGDRTNDISDEYGRKYVEITHPNYWDVSADYAAAQTNTSIKAAPGAGLCLYITDIQISNGAVAGNITLLDGSGGTVKFEIYPAINGGISVSRRTPIKLTANTALCITSTTVTTHSVNIGGFIAP